MYQFNEIMSWFLCDWNFAGIGIIRVVFDASLAGYESNMFVGQPSTIFKHIVLYLG